MSRELPDDLDMLIQGKRIRGTDRPFVKQSRRRAGNGKANK